MKNIIRDFYLFALIFSIYFIGRFSIFFIFPFEEAIPTLEWFLLCLRFDLLTASYILLPSAIFTMIGLVVKKDFSLIKKIYTNIAICASLYIALTNICFFYEYDSQFNHWIFGLFVDDFNAIIETIRQDYPIITLTIALIITFVLICILTNYIYKKTENLNNNVSKLKSVAIIVPYLIALIFMMRGGKLHGRPLQLRDTAVTQYEYLNNLVPTSAYCLKTELSKYFKSTGLAGLKNFDTKPEEMPLFAKKIFKTNKSNIDEILTYKSKGLNISKPKRIFLIVGESNSAWPLQLDMPNYNVCPQQKQLCNNALYCKNALPAGFGTMITVSSIISGIPATELSVKGVLKQSTDYSFAYHMKKIGYSTTFYYAGQSTWLQLGEFAKFNKFDNVIGGESMGNLYGSVEWGLRDKDMFNFIENSNIPENSFNMILTVSNHPPYDVDLKAEGCPVEPKTDLDNKIWHHWYADKCIANFVKNITKKYPDSLIIITGDHPSRMIPNELEAKVKENHTVPIIFYGKSVENLKREIPSMTHLDIMPTLLDMVAPKDFKYKSWGNSIFANERRLQPMNTEVITLNNKILLINSTDCPQEYKELHRMYMALAYYRSISDGSLKQE